MENKENNVAPIFFFILQDEQVNIGTEVSLYCKSIKMYLLITFLNIFPEIVFKKCLIMCTRNVGVYHSFFGVGGGGLA